MKILLKSALVASLLVGTAGIGNAATVGFNIGDVSIGYSDGYWDQGHHWHRWAHRGDAAAYRSAHSDGYHEWRHDDKRHHD
jgi:hypothetical protein